jgi:hypothetical protein
VIDKETLKIRGISQQLVNGEINLAEWQIQMAAQLKTLHVAMGLAASGGVNAADPATLGFIGSQIKEQYKFLRRFARDIKTGRQKLDGSLVARSAMYPQAGRGLYHAVLERKALQAGLQESRSVLAVADHCKQCLSEAARSWVPIGSSIPIGQRICRTSCRCHLEYRKGA